MAQYPERVSECVVAYDRVGEAMDGEKAKVGIEGALLEGRRRHPMPDRRKEQELQGGFQKEHGADGHKEHDQRVATGPEGHVAQQMLHGGYRW